MPVTGAHSALSVALRCCHSQEGGPSPFDEIPSCFYAEVENKTPLSSNLLQPFKTHQDNNTSQKSGFGSDPCEGIKDKEKNWGEGRGACLSLRLTQLF